MPEKVTHGLPWTEGFYGIYSFKIEDEYLGLITRVPGEYSSTKISLWIYDLNNHSITNDVPLADIFGDAGAAESTNSWLFFDSERKLNALTYRHYSYNHSVEEEADTTVDENHNFYLRKINTSSVDTISSDSTKLHAQFKQQFVKMTGY